MKEVVLMIEANNPFDSTTRLSEAAILKRWDTPKWLALYTRSRHEKCLEQELNKRGIETFLPLRKITRDWSDRRKVIEEPLFTGYLFVRMPWRERLAVLNTPGAVHFLGPRVGEPSEVPESDLSSIRKFMQEDIPLDPFPYLKEGERVYIRSGPMKGTEGFILRKDSHCRLVISLDLLMQSVSVEIDQASVEKL